MIRKQWRWRNQGQNQYAAYTSSCARHSNGATGQLRIVNKVTSGGEARLAGASPNGVNFPKRTRVAISSMQPITEWHTNRPCPEPSQPAPSEKTNTSILTVPYNDNQPAKPRRPPGPSHNEVYVFDLHDPYDLYTNENVATVMKVGRVAIITRGRYAGKKVRQSLSPRL